MKHGLKGVTDATAFCKSMQKGGAKPMIRSMKSYAAGGATEQCGPGDRFKKACKKAFKSVGKASETKGGVLSGLITAAVGTLAGLGLKKMKGQE
jgi:hypothetical protein